MATATLTDGPAVQLTFPWALPKAEDESTIVAERSSPSAGGRPGRSARRSRAEVGVRVTVERHATDRHAPAQPCAKLQPSIPVEPKVVVEKAAIASNANVAAVPVTAAPVTAVPVAAAVADGSQCAASFQDSLCQDRIGKPFRVGAVMFRLLKRYGITDEEIAEGIAAYTAKRSAARA